MISVELPESLYTELEHAATRSGVSVVSLIEAAVQHHLREVSDLSDRFTPEVIACLDEAAHMADEGKVVTFDQHEQAFQEKRAAWIQARQNCA